MLNFSMVRKQYARDIISGSQFILHPVSFEIAKGHSLGMIGANGAGKSTCIKLLMDFVRPSGGQIKIMGSQPDRPTSRKRLGYLPETANFPASLNILDLLTFAKTTCSIEATEFKQRSEALLKELGLWAHRRKRLKNYSKGMQQRANFVLALIHNPELLILDEPMSGLDPIGRGEIMELIMNLKMEGKTILFCSHILEDVDRLADQLLILHQGRQLYFGDTRNFLLEAGCENITDAYLSLVQGLPEASP